MIQSDSVRKQFPSLQRKHNHLPIVYLDGPAGTQVPQSVIDAISGYYETSNANTHGAFVTTRETDAIVDHMRQSMASFLGAENKDTISIGQNTTSLNFALSRAFARLFRPGDEVVITQLDHEANRGPWLALGDSGVIIKEVKLQPNGMLDYNDFSEKITARTKLVCMGMSSNCIGTVNNFQLIRELTLRYHAWLLLDAVHFAPHFTIDVQSLGCDFLLCSAYKFYGPHIGILYCRPGLLEQIPTDHLRTQQQSPPYTIETGTLNHAAIAGVSASVDFLAQLGTGNQLREKLISAFRSIGAHEYKLASRLYEGLKKVQGVTLIGQNFAAASRTPTVSFTLEGKTPGEVCEHLAIKNICAWDGHFYALRAIEVLGLLGQGGVTRLGVSLYNTEAEIDLTLREISDIGMLKKN